MTQRERDALLEVLGDDAFGSIYEHHAIRERGMPVGSLRSAPVDRKKKRQSSQSSGRPTVVSSDEEWSVEKELETSQSAVKARRRLLVSKNTANRATLAQASPGGSLGLAALAARAGEQADLDPAGTRRTNAANARRRFLYFSARQ